MAQMPMVKEQQGSAAATRGQAECHPLQGLHDALGNREVQRLGARERAAAPPAISALSGQEREGAASSEHVSPPFPCATKARYRSGR